MKEQETPGKHTSPNSPTGRPTAQTAKHSEPPTEQAAKRSKALTVTLFVYGTLMSGQANHDRFCRHAIDIRPATTWGRLYHLPAGYPALEVPEATILAHGTADALADAATQARLSAHAPPHAANRPPSGDLPSRQGFGETDWDLIHGELITLPDPARDLPPIDRLEGFRPGRRSLYQRALVTVQTRDEAIPAWLYVAGCCLICSGERLHSGAWG